LERIAERMIEYRKVGFHVSIVEDPIVEQEWSER
jgi:hypothetical protein